VKVEAWRYSTTFDPTFDVRANEGRAQIILDPVNAQTVTNEWRECVICGRETIYPDGVCFTCAQPLMRRDPWWLRLARWLVR
jgi:hypothetical protein